MTANRHDQPALPQSTPHAERITQLWSWFLSTAISAFLIVFVLLLWTMVCGIERGAPINWQKVDVTLRRAVTGGIVATAIVLLCLGVLR